MNTDKHVLVVCDARGKDYIAKAGTGEPSLRRVSPEFDSLADLFPWMHKNGWKLDTENHPWGVSRFTA